MCAKFGLVPTAVSKILSFKFISRSDIIITSSQLLILFVWIHTFSHQHVSSLILIYEAVHSQSIGTPNDQSKLSGNVNRSNHRSHQS